MTAATLYLFSPEIDILMKFFMKCVNIKLWDILGCFHYILNAYYAKLMFMKGLEVLFDLLTQFKVSDGKLH